MKLSEELPDPWKPNDLEIEVLRILNGEDVPGWTWGAAMSVCCGTLKAMGLAQGSYEISEKGKAYLAALAAKEKNDGNE